MIFAQNFMIVFGQKIDSRKYIKILFVCFILIILYRLLILWRNMQKSFSEPIIFDFYLTEIKYNCLYQANGKYIFVLPNCAAYETNRQYRVIAKTKLSSDNGSVFHKNIDITSFTPIKKNSLLDFFQLNTIGTYLRQSRKDMISLIRSTFNRHFSPLSASLAVSLVLGSQTSPLPKWQRHEFITLGLSHLVAVSGTHLHLFIFFFQGLFAFTKRRRLLCIMTISVAIIFSWLVGNPASALRALLMLILTLIVGNFLLSSANQFYNLFLSVLLILLLGENYFSGAGLYLSLAATLAVIIASLVYRDLTRHRLWREQSFLLIHGVSWQNIIFRFYSLIKQLLQTALFVQFLILPVQIYFFKTFSPLNFVTSAFFSALFAFFILSLIVLAALTLIFGYWWWGQQLIIAPLALLIRIPLELSLGLISFIVDFFSLFTFSAFSLPWYIYLLYLFLLINGAFFYRHWRSHRFDYADNPIF